MIASDNVPSDFDLEARINRIMRNTNKTKNEALEQARAELLQEQAHLDSTPSIDYTVKA